MPDEETVIGYGTAFTTSFLGMSTTLRVVSPINTPAPEVSVEIHYTVDKKDKSVSVEGAFFENLLDILASIRQHTDLLTGAEFGFLASITNDHQAILFSKVGSAQVSVWRKRGVLSGGKDVAQVIIGNLQIQHDLNDDFFQRIEKLRSTIDQVKKRIADKMGAYIASKRM